MNDTFTLNKGVVIWIGAALLVIIGVVVVALMLKGQQDAQAGYSPVDPRTGTAVFHPPGAAPGWQLMPRYSTAPANPSSAQLQRAAPYAGANRGAELMPVPPTGGTLAK